MNLYLISQEINKGYDTFDSAVIAAESEQGARTTHPETWDLCYGEDYWISPYGEKSDEDLSCWVAHPSEVSVKYLGQAVEGTQSGVILASFNAG